MNVLQVNTIDVGGGAENIAWRLFEEFRKLKMGSWLAVGAKRSTDEDVFQISNKKNKNFISRKISNGIEKFEPYIKDVKGLRRVLKLLEDLSEPTIWLKKELGIENLDFPASKDLLELVPQKPDLVHFHNLHGPFLPGGGYFNLKLLPWMSHRIPVVITLHDSWLFTGHCAHFFECDRWKSGCGRCPDLTIYPPIRRDSSSRNIKTKEKIFSTSRLFVTTPSRWMMNQVEHSILAPAIVDKKVIPNGVDLSIFQPKSKREARRILNMEPDGSVILFAGNEIKNNPWKDFRIAQEAFVKMAGMKGTGKVTFIVLGDQGKSEKLGLSEIRFIPFQRDPRTVARYFQASDIYCHPAKADTFPTSVIEALACGLPVVGSAVGGIPEQIYGLDAFGKKLGYSELNPYSLEEATGILTPSKDACAFTEGIRFLLDHKEIRAQLGQNARRMALSRFDFLQQAQIYLEWFENVIEMWKEDNRN